MENEKKKTGDDEKPELNAVLDMQLMNPFFFTRCWNLSFRPYPYSLIPILRWNGVREERAVISMLDA